MYCNHITEVMMMMSHLAVACVVVGGLAPVGMYSPYLGHGRSWDKQRFEVFFGDGAGVKGILPGFSQCAILFGKCVCKLKIVYIWLLRASPQTPAGDLSWTQLREFRPLDPLSPPYFQTLVTPLTYRAYTTNDRMYYFGFTSVHNAVCGILC